MDALKKLYFEQSALQVIASGFGCLIREIRAVRGVWRIRDANGLSYAVKPFFRGLSALLLAARVHLKVNMSDPLLLPELRRTVRNEPFMVFKGCPVLCLNWLEGRTLDYRNWSDRRRALKTVVRWQEAVNGTPVPAALQYWGGWGRILEKRLDELRQCRRMAERIDNPFSRVYLRQWDFYYAQADLCREYFEHECCRQIFEEARLRGEICHGDWAHHNLLLQAGGNVAVLDLEYLQGNLGLLDFINLLVRFLLLDEGKTRIIETFARWLNEFRPLSEAEKFSLKALFHWPEEYWMAGRQYFIEHLPRPERLSLLRLQRKVPPPEVWLGWQKELDLAL